MIYKCGGQANRLADFFFQINEEEWTSADCFQEPFANHLMLHQPETVFVVNDKEKRELDFRRCVLQSWIIWINYEASLAYNRCQKQATTVVLVMECKGYLITVYMTSGVKLTGMQYRVLYGTREIADALLTWEGTRPYKDSTNQWWRTKP